MRPSYNNAATIASSVTVSSLKLHYYKLFALAYRWAGQHAQVVMVNSSWTRMHVESLWWPEGSSNSGDKIKNKNNYRRTLALVFPPCNTTELQSIPLEREKIVRSSARSSAPAAAALHVKSKHAAGARQTRSSQSSITSANAAAVDCGATDDVDDDIQDCERESTPPSPPHKRIILSIGQFRPEKDHMLQIR